MRKLFFILSILLSTTICWAGPSIWVEGGGGGSSSFTEGITIDTNDTKTIDIDSTDTGAHYIEMTTDGGLAKIGLESSLGGGAFAGSSADALVLGTQNTDPIQFATGNAIKMELDENGRLGIGTTAPLAPLHVGDGTRSGTDEMIIVSRAVSNAGNMSGTNAHAFSDRSEVTRGGDIGYNSYDMQGVLFSGTADYDHYAGVQFAPVYNSSGTLDVMYGSLFAPVISDGVVTEYRAVAIGLAASTGQVTNYKGIYIGTPTVGTSSNYAIYIQGGNSYVGGNILLGNTGIGTNAAGVLGVANKTAPADSPNNMVQIYSEDLAAGDSALHLMTESDDIYKFGSYAVLPGNVRVGATSAPSEALSVSGTVGVTGDISAGGDITATGACCGADFAYDEEVDFDKLRKQVRDKTLLASGKPGRISFSETVTDFTAEHERAAMRTLALYDQTKWLWSFVILLIGWNLFTHIKHRRKK